MVPRVIGSVVSIPGEVLGALRVLPRLLTEVEKIARHTAALPRVEEAIGKVSGDTAVLPGMYERMAAIEEVMPTLVDVQRRLADLPSTMAAPRGRDGRPRRDAHRLLASLDQLDANVTSLRDAVEPLARVADRVPSRRRG